MRLPRTRRRRIAWALSGIAFAGILFLNAVAYLQARAMTHFTDGGVRTSPPEALTRLQKVRVLLMGVKVPRPEDSATPADVGLEYQTVRFGGLSGKDCEGWFIGARKPKGVCIEFHGYSSSKSSLLHSAQAFHGLGYDVLLVDFRGSGGSIGDNTSLGYFEADDVAGAMKFAAGEWPGEPIVLYGESMGGAAVLRAAGELGVQPRAIVIESVFDRLLSTVENRFDAMRVPEFPAARLLVFWGGVQQGYDAFDLNPADYATRVTCPVLLMQGGRDPRVTDAQARNLFDHLAGPKRLEIFETSGHCGMLSDDRGRWISSISGFLAKNR